MVEFNPRNEDRTTGPGKIRLGGEEQAKPADSGRPKWLFPAVAAGAAVVVVAGGVALFSGDDEEPPVTNPPIAEETQPPVAEVIPEQRPPQVQPAPEERPVYVPSPAERLAASIRAKESAIYRNEALAYRDDSNRRAEVYLDADGNEVEYGDDFAVHASMFDKGGISVFIAEGPYAGSRIGFFPAAPAYGNKPTVVYEKVGTLDDGGYFKPLAPAERISRTASMKNPATAGDGVALPDGAASYEEEVYEDADGNGFRSSDETFTAFVLKGSPQTDGVFSVELPFTGGDYYTVDLGNGEFSVSSLFANYPDWQERPESVPENAHVPTVNGVFKVEPAMRPGAPAPGLRP